MSRPCARCGGAIDPGAKRNRRYCDACQPAAIAEARGKRHDLSADALPPGRWVYNRRTGAMDYQYADAADDPRKPQAGAPTVFAARTHCKNGHEFTDDNTIRKFKQGRNVRLCRACQRDYKAAHKARKDAA